MKHTHFSDNSNKAPQLNLSVKGFGKRVRTEEENDKTAYFSSPKFTEIQPYTPISYNQSDSNRNLKNYE